MLINNDKVVETDFLTFGFCTLTKDSIARSLDNGADINGTNRINGKSILTIVVRNYVNGNCDDADTISYLLHKGADPLLEDKNGDSMFTIAERSCNIELLSMIVKYLANSKKERVAGEQRFDGRITNILVSSCSENSINIRRIIELVKAGADPNGVSSDSTASAMYKKSPLTVLTGRYLRSTSELGKRQILSYVRGVIKCGGNGFVA
ncbi:ankyrin repeat domain-containing protein [Wolbachia endosymbiont of Ctenocephalides felis wCfeT]|uniref:hypothetical protein n=1 Tax=Wolbachia endosymbiont of Ctenocephalides felis wCfeT TaxID=2732593 RepID=UPI001444B66D|nr:hypothetical protein [Wolbachia endosymbiont of Ctenocephalides felis wCfeT]